MATAVMANETEIADAIGVLRVAGLDDEMLDEIELDRELQLSLEEEDTISLGEWEKRVMEKVANGYYRR
ncbi:MAG: hypothetical protein FWC26_07845 [Fibromonadales bacterium]|nr:hypothetical protein [Fibromonadales bacterium]